MDRLVTLRTNQDSSHCELIYLIHKINDNFSYKYINYMKIVVAIMCTYRGSDDAEAACLSAIMERIIPTYGFTGCRWKVPPWSIVFLIKIIQF